MSPEALRHSIHWLTRRFVDLLCRFEVTGREYVPSSGPGLIIFNHTSNFDLPLVYAAVPRPDVIGLVAADYRTRWWIRVLIEAQGSLWLRRGESDRETLRRARDVLASGRMLGMSPEGGRSSAGSLREARPGAASLALTAGVPVVPAGIVGANQLHRSWRRFHRPAITLRFGPAVDLPSASGLSRKAHRREATTAMMEAVARLLPPRYRGVYQVPGVPGRGPLSRRGS
jgi:1-acyl-sn-glycerol-3-phosphate acyltransferase